MSPADWAALEEAGEWLAHTIDDTEAVSAVALPEPCEDASCRSLRRTRGGMRTNGGCRCSPLVLAVEHARAIVALTSAPSWHHAMLEAQANARGEL